MDPLLSKEEKNMRDKILQHEFPFDEKAWGAMKTLLEEQNNEKGGGVPAAKSEPVPGPGKRWMWLLLLFFTLGLGAASMIWTTRPGKTSETFNAKTTTPSSKQPSETIHPSNNLSIAVQPATTANTGHLSAPVRQTNTALPSDKRLAAPPKTMETSVSHSAEQTGISAPVPLNDSPNVAALPATADQRSKSCIATPGTQPPMPAHTTSSVSTCPYPTAGATRHPGTPGERSGTPDAAQRTWFNPGHECQCGGL
jgi:hypothetical protein